MNERDSVTVKELKEKLNQFPDNLIVVVGSRFLPDHIWYVPVENVSSGVNEFDGLVFIDDCEEDG
jgi:hypothetical protein